MSETPLAQRLQVKHGRRLAVLHASPALDAAIGAAAERAALPAADVVLLFVEDGATLAERLPPTLTALRREAIPWLAYPKRSSPLARDLHRDAIAALIPSYGLDTVAQIAIDEDRSALRLKRLG